MSRHIVRVSAVLLLTSAPLFAQLTIGNAFSASPNASDSNISPVRTDVDLTGPASGTGTVTSVHVYWSQFPLFERDQDQVFPAYREHVDDDRRARAFQLGGRR
ncbi:MAG: hypothetical protein QOK37_2704 [Thermoanaerobaculia bacterium]|jgi:hypothetical protein|nr:hypothetical protein [Thermoanaerobaculia bacterium]